MVPLRANEIRHCRSTLGSQKLKWNLHNCEILIHDWAVHNIKYFTQLLLALNT